MLTPYLPYPLWSGGQIRTYNLLKNLSCKHEITLFSFIRDHREKEYIRNLGKYCENVQVFIKRPPWSFTSLSLSAVTFYPLVVCMYLNNDVKRKISEEIEKRHFDLIHAETFYVMPNIPNNRIPIILAEQTIEYLVYRHFTQTVKFLPKKIMMDWDVAKIHFWEKRFWKKAVRVIAMSEADRKVMKKHDVNLKVDLVPNGVDTKFFRDRKRNRKLKKKILFVGNFKWLQNREAVMVLVEKVWPRVKQKFTDASLWIVGKNPTENILNYRSETVDVDDSVTDIRQAYYQSDALLAPIFGPGGTRYKILEAMACGLPVVTTSVGIEGLDAEKKQAVLIGNDEDQLAEGIIDVLTDDDLYQKLSSNGRKLVEQNFAWETITSRLDKIYQEAVLGKS